MRIISKFFDYYDKAAPFDHEDGLIYVRNTKQIPIKSNSGYYSDYFSINSDFFLDKSVINSYDEFVRLANNQPKPTICHTGLIAFCGKIYPYYHLWINNKTYFSLKAIQTDLNDNFSKYSEDISDYYQSKLNFEIICLKNFFKKKVYASRKYVDVLSFDDNNGKPLSDDFFREFDAPIVVLKGGYDGGLVINDRLSQYNFISQVDPCTAYQEISMFIGNNLVKQVDPTTSFSDDLKRDIHGFDKFSFRKPKKKK